MSSQHPDPLSQVHLKLPSLKSPFFDAFSPYSVRVSGDSEGNYQWAGVFVVWNCTLVVIFQKDLFVDLVGLNKTTNLPKYMCTPFVRAEAFSSVALIPLFVRLPTGQHKKVSIFCGFFFLTFNSVFHYIQPDR